MEVFAGILGSFQKGFSKMSCRYVFRRVVLVIFQSRNNSVI